VLKFDQSKADGIEIVHGRMTTALGKMGNDWFITKPYKARADFAAAEAILTALSSAQMQKIAANEAADLGKYGLDKPDATVTAIAGSTRASVAIVRRMGESNYARDLSRPAHFHHTFNSRVGPGEGRDSAARKDSVRCAVVQYRTGGTEARQRNTRL
jgi:hypothetical protein